MKGQAFIDPIKPRERCSLLFSINLRAVVSGDKFCCDIIDVLYYLFSEVLYLNGHRN